MDIGKKVISSLRWMVMSRFTGQLITWTITIIVVRILTPADYGLMAMATTVTALVFLLNEMGLGAALIQKSELDRQTVSQVFGLLILINIAVYALLFLASPFIATFFEEPRLTPILRVISLSFLLMPLTSVPQAILSRRMDFRKIAFVDLSRVLTASVVTLALALTEHGVWSLVLGNLSGALMGALGFNIAARYWCWPRFAYKGMGHFISFGGLVALDRVLWFVFTQFDIFIIGKLIGKESLGIYSVAKHLASLPMEKIAGMLNQVGLAAYSRIQHDRQLVRQHLSKAVRLVSLGMFPVFFGLSVVSPELIPLLLGEKWSEAVIPMQTLSLVMPLRMLATLLPPALMGLGRPEINVGNLLIACVLMPGSLIVAVRWGLLGAALTWVTVYPCYFLIVLKRSLPTLGLSVFEFLKLMFPAAFSATLMYIVVYELRESVAAARFIPAVNLGILITVGILTYGLVTLITQRNTVREAVTLIRR